jgi:hypothetical protein
MWVRSLLFVNMKQEKDYKDPLHPTNVRKSHLIWELRKYMKQRFPSTDHWVDPIILRIGWAYSDFYKFIFNRKAIPTFIILLSILLFLNLVYFAFFIVSLVYWLYQIIKFLNNSSINEVKPSKHHLNFSGEIRTLVFIYTVYRPYLFTFKLLYNLLKLIYKPETIKINTKTLLIITLLFSIALVIRDLVGLPLRVIHDAYIWSQRWLKIEVDEYVGGLWLDKLKDRSLDIAFWVFENIRRVESRRIFRNKNSIEINFNPIFVKNSGINESLAKTTLIPIIENYAHKLYRGIDFQSFKYSGDQSTKCFKNFHSGSILTLESGDKILINFLTKSPRDNLPRIMKYDMKAYYKHFNYKPNFDTDLYPYTHDMSSNLFLLKEEWKIVPVTFRNAGDFRKLYCDNRIYVKNSILYLVFNHKFSEFNANYQDCTRPSTRSILSEDDIIFQLQNDIRSNYENLKFITQPNNNLAIVDDYVTSLLELGDIHKEFEVLNDRTDFINNLLY